MSHIAIDARIINSSTGRYVERLLHYLQQLDHDNTYTILVRAKDERFWQPTNKNFSVKVADFDNYSFEEQTRYNKFLRKLKPDLVHFCMPQQPVLYRGLHVTTFHDLTLLSTYNSDKNWLKYHGKQLVGRFVFRRVARNSAHILTPSKYTKERLVQFAGIDENKVTVTYEAADEAKGGDRAYPLPFKKYLLYVGQQSDYKNIKLLGDAHQKLLFNYPDLGLVLAGKINAAAQKNKDYFEYRDYQNVIFTDFVDDAQLAWLYKHAAAYVFPSLMEGFGLPGLEAMTYGAPVISSDATCLPEIYGDAAHYFNPHDKNAIAEAVIDVLDGEKYRQELIKKGYQQIKKYSWRRMAEQTLAVYEHVLRSRL